MKEELRLGRRVQATHGASSWPKRFVYEQPFNRLQDSRIGYVTHQQMDWVLHQDMS